MVDCIFETTVSVLARGSHHLLEYHAFIRFSLEHTQYSLVFISCTDTVDYKLLIHNIFCISVSINFGKMSESAASAPKRQCVFKCEKPAEGKIILFNSEKYEKVLNKLKIKKKVGSSKHKDLDLPASRSENDGYHSQCYSNFTSINARDMARYNALCHEGKLQSFIENFY